MTLLTLYINFSQPFASRFKPAYTAVSTLFTTVATAIAFTISIAIGVITIAIGNVIPRDKDREVHKGSIKVVLDDSGIESPRCHRFVVKKAEELLVSI